MTNTYNRYEQLLKERGVTSYRVAKETGIAQSTLAEWKTGRSQPKVEKLIILSKFFEVPLDYFFGKGEDG